MPLMLRQFFSLSGYLARYLLQYLGVFGDAVRHFPSLSRPPFFRVLLKQIYFTGIESLLFLSVVAMILGFAAADQLYEVLVKDLQRTLDVFRLLIVEEASVFLVSFYVLARSGSAIASELASCKQQGEVATLYRMGINPSIYLVAPRILACMLSVSALTVYFQVVLVLGGFALMSFVKNWDFTLAMDEFMRGVNPGSAVLVILRSLVFGAVIGTVACSQGLRAVTGPQGIPVAARTAIVHGLAGILVAAVLLFVLTA